MPDLVYPGGSSTTVSKTGIVAAPGAGATLVTIPATSFLRGHYLVAVYIWLSGTLIAGDANNVKLADTASNLFGGVDGLLAYPALPGPYGPFKWSKFMDGTVGLNLTIVGASGTTTYGALVVADQITRF